MILSNRNAVRGALAIAALACAAAHAVPLTPDELAKVCAQAEDSAHCGRLVEEVQLKRLPSLATRDGTTLRVSLFPSGTATFTDTEALNGGRSYSLWDFISEINAAVLYVTDGDDVSFTVLQRATGRKTDMPADPKLSPDKARIVTADFCELRCVNELALWRVTRDGIRKESTWKPRETWTDVVATWKSPGAIAIEYTTAAPSGRLQMERKLDDASWVHAPAP